MQPVNISSALVALVGVAALTGTAVSAADKPDAACGALRDTVFDAGYVTSARVVGADGGTPAYCEVRATALPAISIEVVKCPTSGLTILRPASPILNEARRYKM